MNCSTDYNFCRWPGLENYSVPEWNPIPDEAHKPQVVSNTVQLSESTLSTPKELSKKKITKGAHKIHSSEKTSQCTKRNNPWTPVEDKKLVEGVKKYGLNRSWKKIARQQFSGKRTNKQCRDRYTENLDPGLRHGPLTGEEIRKFIQIVDSIKKDKKDEPLSAIQKLFNKDLEPGQLRSRSVLKCIHQRLKKYSGRYEISSSVFTTSSSSLSKDPMQTSVAKNEIDIEAFIRDYENQKVRPVQEKEEVLQRSSVSTVASGISWSKEEDAKLIEAVGEYGKKWQKISSLGILERCPEECYKRWTEYLDPAFDWSPAKPREKNKLLAIYQSAKKIHRNQIDWQAIEDQFNNNQEVAPRRNKHYLKRLYENIDKSQKSRKRKSISKEIVQGSTKKQEISPTEFNPQLLPELLEHKENSSNPLSSTENVQPINPFLINPQFFLSLISLFQQQGTVGSNGT